MTNPRKTRAARRASRSAPATENDPDTETEDEALTQEEERPRDPPSDNDEQIEDATTTEDEDPAGGLGEQLVHVDLHQAQGAAEPALDGPNQDPDAAAMPPPPPGNEPFARYCISLELRQTADDDPLPPAMTAPPIATAILGGQPTWPRPTEIQPLSDTTMRVYYADRHANRGLPNQRAHELAEEFNQIGDWLGRPVRVRSDVLSLEDDRKEQEARAAARKLADRIAGRRSAQSSRASSKGSTRASSRHSTRSGSRATSHTGTAAPSRRSSAASTAASSPDRVARNRRSGQTQKGCRAVCVSNQEGTLVCPAGPGESCPVALEGAGDIEDLAQGVPGLVEAPTTPPQDRRAAAAKALGDDTPPSGRPARTIDYLDDVLFNGQREPAVEGDGKPSNWCPRIPKFSGEMTEDVGSYEAFRSGVVAASRMGVRWNSLKLSILNATSGIASRYGTSALNKPGACAESYIAHMDQTYQPQGELMEWIMLLQDMSQNKDEPVAAFAARISSMGITLNEKHPGNEGLSRQAQTRALFQGLEPYLRETARPIKDLCGSFEELRDRLVKFESEMRPGTGPMRYAAGMDEGLARRNAACIAAARQQYDRATKSQGNLQVNYLPGQGKGSHHMKQAVSARGAPCTPPAIWQPDDLVPSNIPIIDENELREAGMELVMRELKQQESDCRERRPANPNTRCFLCGGMGHYAADCPEKKSGSREKRCYKCNSVGHVAHDCPNNRQNALNGDRGWYRKTEAVPQTAPGYPPQAVISKQLMASSSPPSEGMGTAMPQDETRAQDCTPTGESLD